MRLETGYRTKRDFVADYLRQEIRAGRILPGQRLFQDVIANTLSVSITPVREALQVLVQEGTLAYAPHKGVTVAELQARDVREIYRIREELEVLALREGFSAWDSERIRALVGNVEQMATLADGVEADAQRQITTLNDQFHILLIEGARMSRLSAMLAHLRNEFPRDFFAVVPGRARLSVQEHAAIVAAIERRALDAAEHSLRVHIQSACRSLLDALQKSGV